MTTRLNKIIRRRRLADGYKGKSDLSSDALSRITYSTRLTQSAKSELITNLLVREVAEAEKTFCLKIIQLWIAAEKKKKKRALTAGRRWEHEHVCCSKPTAKAGCRAKRFSGLKIQLKTGCVAYLLPIKRAENILPASEEVDASVLGTSWFYLLKFNLKSWA